MTSVPGVFTAGDMQRGIAHRVGDRRRPQRSAGGRSVLMGKSDLPAPLA